MTFFFNDSIEYKWHPQDYLVQPLDSKTHYCVGVKTLSHMILGAIFMRNYDIYFDRTAKKVGFMRSNCGMDPYFIDDLSKRPDDAPIPLVQSDKPVIISPAEIFRTPLYDPDIPKMNVNKPIVDESEDEGSSFKVLIILTILLAGIMGGLMLLRNLWKQSRTIKDVQSEVNTTIDLTEHSV